VFLLRAVLARHTGRRSVRRSRGSTEACPAVTELLATFLVWSACLPVRTGTSPPLVGLLVPKFPSHEGRLARGTGYWVPLLTGEVGRFRCSLPVRRSHFSLSRAALPPYIC
jgi:hypothetical protein